MKKKKQDIIVNSTAIRTLLKKRFEELSLTYTNIISDANSLGNTSITKSCLSIYLNNKDTVNQMTQENVIWLCIRYGVDIKIPVTYIKDYSYEDFKLKLNSFKG